VSLPVDASRSCADASIAPQGPRRRSSARLRAAASGLGRFVAVLAAVLAGLAHPGAPAQGLDPALLQRIDAFVEREREASRIPGIALAIVDAEGASHVRGFGEDGRGRPIDADTPFPIGSLTKSFTALLVRQASDAGALDVDAPVQRHLPWFRVADEQASRRITLRQLLNQTSGLSRGDGMRALLHDGNHDGASSVEELARGLAELPLQHAPGERYEYSNLNFVLLGAVLEQAMGQPWAALVRERILDPLRMTHSDTDPASARLAGMTRLHRMEFGFPFAEQPRLPPGLAPTGGLVASAHDMASYLRLMIDAGTVDGRRLVSAHSIEQMLAPASPPASARLLGAGFTFRYGEGWFVGPFGAAADARWHLGNLPSFVAWMVLLPATRQAFALLINASTGLPLDDATAVMSRLPLGVANLLRGQPPPTGPSLPQAYRRFNAAAALSLGIFAAAAWLAARARRGLWAWLLPAATLVLFAALSRATGLGPTILIAMAPDLALVLALALGFAGLPLMLRALRFAGRRPARRSLR